MKREPAWRRYLRFWGPDPAFDIDDEFQFHLQTKTEALIAAGWRPDEARREAARQFGPLRDVRKECAAISLGRQAKASRAEYFAGWARDLQYAVRMLLKARASTAAAILILAVGIGASTAVFTFLDRLLLAPLPVPEPSRLQLVSCSGFARFPDGGRIKMSCRYDAYLRLRDENQAFSGLAAIGGLNIVERRGRDKIDHPAEVQSVSGNFFDVLGAPPLLGRGLTPADDTAGSPLVAIASFRFWSNRYNRAADVLGRTVYLNDAPFTIVGVMPRGFAGIYKGADPDLYIPLARQPEIRKGDSLNSANTSMFGRLKRSVSPGQAQANLQSLAQRFLAEQPAAGPGPGFQFRIEPASARVELEDGTRGVAGASGEKKRNLFLVGVIVALLLLMGCVNVTCLLLARGATRRHEMAIRLSLGATRARILRQAFVESSLLALAGGAAGLAVAFWANRLLVAAFQWQDRALDLSLDGRVLAFSVALSLIAGILFGLAPAIQFLRGGRLTFSQERTVAPRFASGRGLVVVEVALSLVMVAGAAVFVRSFQNLRSTPLGFSAERVSILRLGNPDGELHQKLPVVEASALADSLRGSRGIESVALADFATFHDSSVGYRVSRPDVAGFAPLNTSVLRVDPNYLAAFHIPLLAGRNFTARDDERAPNVAILGESAARHLFANENPLGKIVSLFRDDRTEIIGVAKDIKFRSVAAPAPDLLYQPLPQGQNHAAEIKLQVRSRLAPGDLALKARALIGEQRLPLSLTSATALEDEIGATLINDRIRMQATGLFGILALLLITAGIYGLMAYSVAQRTREIGIRMAIGSTPSKIVRMVLKESLRLVAIGALLGLPGAYFVMKAVHSMVFELAPVDPVSLAAATAILIVTGAAATVAPAWRAAHLDPVRALRVQ